MTSVLRLLRIAFVLIPLSAVCAAAQQPSEKASQWESGYVLGPDDQIVIRALDVDEISDKPISIGIDGYITLPMVGRIRAGNLTVAELEKEIATRLKDYVRGPQVSITVAEFRSQPVSVLGAVATSGVVQLRGRKTLLEVISAAGGLRSEAGNTIKITRQKKYGSIPLPSAVDDSTGKFSVAEVGVKSVMEARKPEENIEIKPYDVISIPRADLIYVIGSVRRSGGFALTEREHITVLQALSMAEGLDRTASGRNARILRAAAGTSTRKEIRVNVNDILAGKISDVPLQADDILFVPNSASKAAILRGIEAAITTASGIAVWGRY